MVTVTVGWCEYRVGNDDRCAGVGESFLNVSWYLQKKQCFFFESNYTIWKHQFWALPLCKIQTQTYMIEVHV